MKAVDTSNIIYLHSHNNSVKQDNLKRYRKTEYQWEKIIRANNRDKCLSEKGIKILSNAVQKLRKEKEISYTHSYLTTLTKCKYEQNNNILNELTDVLNIKFNRSVVIKGRKYRDRFTVSYTENGQQILENPELFYTANPLKNSVFKTKKFSEQSEKIQTANIRIISEEVEEKDLIGLFSSTVNTTAGINTARARKPANQNNTPVEPTQEPQQITSQSHPATMSFECSSQLEIAINQKEAITICNQLTKLPELRRKIAQTFGANTAQELAYETTYTELTADKIAVRLGEGVKMTDHDKERLRDCIRAVYGQNVQIVTGKPKISELVTNSDQLKRIKNPENEEPMTLALAIPTEQIAAIIPYIPTTPIWHKVRQNLINKHGSDLVNVRLKRLEITEQEGMIAFTGPLSNTYLVANNFDQKLQECSELYDVVFKFMGTCMITGEIEERIIKSWHKGE